MAFCPGCGAEVDETAVFCTECGRPLSAKSPADVRKDMYMVEREELQPKYTAMWLGVWILKVFGWLTMIVGSIVFIVVGADIAGDPEYTTGEGVGYMIGGVIGSVLYGILKLAVADLFHKVKNM